MSNFGPNVPDSFYALEDPGFLRPNCNPSFEPKIAVSDSDNDTPLPSGVYSTLQPVSGHFVPAVRHIIEIQARFSESHGDVSI